MAAVSPSPNAAAVMVSSRLDAATASAAGQRSASASRIVSTGAVEKVVSAAKPGAHDGDRDRSQCAVAACSHDHPEHQPTDHVDRQRAQRPGGQFVVAKASLLHPAVGDEAKGAPSAPPIPTANQTILRA